MIKNKWVIFLNILFLSFIMCYSSSLMCQNNHYWQQKVDYKMSVELNTKNHKFEGDQLIKYYNNSPDTLNKIYIHLYFNAFQPNSMMDVRSRNIVDPDSRVGERISLLKNNEIGILDLISIKQNDIILLTKKQGTILEVNLNKPILPNDSSMFQTVFEGQVPLQIRRSGRDNKEGVSYSMAQWYPKIAEYDYMGWHTNPYIGREFYGVWGNYDVTIMLDSDYKVAGTGYLQTKKSLEEVYRTKNKGKATKWHFIAPNVHDFVWAADTEYTHKSIQVAEGPTLHFFYLKTETNEDSWNKLPEYMVKAMTYVSKNYGKYPYKQYSFIQGGDGGMEYPMATLITGNREFKSLLGVSVHEMIHSWYQGVLANNESLHEWMDEGFTSYVEDETMAYLLNLNDVNPHENSYKGYFFMANSGNEEPLTTHADHYKTNRSYGINAYYKGAVFLNQLKYIVGTDVFMKGMRRYFNEWKFKHPTPIALMRVMEKESDMQLDWYWEHFVNTTNQIDYGIDFVGQNKKNVIIRLKRHGDMMMPIDLDITYKDGTSKTLYIPLSLMLGEKSEGPLLNRKTWFWTNPYYTVNIEENLEDIKSITIDKSGRMADISRKNNELDLTTVELPYKANEDDK